LRLVGFIQGFETKNKPKALLLDIKKAFDYSGERKDKNNMKTVEFKMEKITLRISKFVYCKGREKKAFWYDLLSRMDKNPNNKSCNLGCFMPTL
jgi:hypothetical protein